MESFGARLKREREQRKITLDDISLATKIGTRFLAALEEEHFDQLPGGIFNKGFVRAYARHLGIDENQAIADFVAASAPSLPESPPPDTPVLESMAVRVPESKRKSRGNDGIPWGIVAVVLLITALGFALWGFHSREKGSIPGVTAPSPAPAETSLPAAQTAAAEPASLKTTSPAAPSPAPESAVAPGTAVPAATTPNTGVFLVLIKAREDAWVSITADGKQVSQDHLTAAAQKSIEAHTQLVIKTGNVGALAISLNGKMLVSQGRHNDVKTLTFDSNGLRP